MKKGQASLDFLMTYGWALLLVVLIVGALFALGIFDAGTFLGSRQSGFAQISPTGWRLEPSGDFTLKLKNNSGTDIEITDINATLRTDSIAYTTAESVSSGRQTDTLAIGTFPNALAAGSSYSVRIEIEYTDIATDFVYKDTGTVTGKVA